MFQLFDVLTFYELAQTRLLLIIEVGKLGDTDMREVLRTESEKAPHLKIHRFHRELMRQIEVFVTQLGKITLVQGVLLIVVRDGLQFEESGLSHEDGLYLEKVVAMVGYGRKRQSTCPEFEGIVVDTKAVVTRKGDEVGILPRAVTEFHALSDGLRLLLQSLRLQGSHPGMNHQSRKIRNHLVTRRVGVRLLQLLIMLPDIVGHVELHLFEKLSVGIHHLCIENGSHVENHVGVVLVLVVTVQIPVTRLVVDLHIPHPQGSVDSHLRIEEVGTCVAVVQSRVNHFDVLSVARFQSPQREQLVLPHIMQQLLHSFKFNVKLAAKIHILLKTHIVTTVKIS